MRIATSTHVATGVALGIVVGIGIVASRLDEQPPPQQPSVDLSPSADLKIEPSSSTAIHEPAPPPEGPFYASLFVAGKTWTLPCTFDEQPSGMQRCHVFSVEVTGQTTSARIGCWYVEEGQVPNPAVNTYVMTPTGLYMVDATGKPMFTPHPVPKSLPKRWGLEEPNGATWANAIVHHHGAWCTDAEFQSLDTSAGYTECISRRGIVGLGHTSFGGFTERCGDVP